MQQKPWQPGTRAHLIRALLQQRCERVPAGSGRVDQEQAQVGRRQAERVRLRLVARAACLGHVCQAACIPRATCDADPRMHSLRRSVVLQEAIYLRILGASRVVRSGPHARRCPHFFIHSRANQADRQGWSARTALLCVLPPLCMQGRCVRCNACKRASAWMCVNAQGATRQGSKPAV